MERNHSQPTPSTADMRKTPVTYNSSRIDESWNLRLAGCRMSAPDLARRSFCNVHKGLNKAAVLMTEL
jgi:hypothetical protein